MANLLIFLEVGGGSQQQQQQRPPPLPPTQQTYTHLTNFLQARSPARFTAAAAEEGAERARQTTAAAVYLASLVGGAERRGFECTDWRGDGARGAPLKK